jgi:RNA polymerase sigma factor (sigma-70 family)
MRDDSPVIGLVTRSQAGDQQAWDALVERYAPLVWSICRRYRLGRADAEDVSQNVWLRLVEQLGNLRDPAALPGWLATTTQRECLRILRAAHRPVLAQLPDADNMPDGKGRIAEDELLIAERHTALREAFTGLPACCQRLLALLIEDPPVPYAQISAILGIPVGSIGPHRRRCLDKLRRHPAIAALANAEGGDSANGGPQGRTGDPVCASLPWLCHLSRCSCQPIRRRSGLYG